MTTSTPRQSGAFRASQAVAVGVLAVVVGAVVGTALCGQVGWAEGRALTTAAGLAAGVWILAAVLACQVLVIGTGLSVDRLGMGVLAASMSRMLMALFAGLLVYFVFRPEGRTFWVVFLACGLVALFAEALWAVRVINSPARGHSATPANQGAA